MTMIDSSSKFKLRGKWELGKNILHNNKMPLKEKKKNKKEGLCSIPRVHGKEAKHSSMYL